MTNLFLIPIWKRPAITRICLETLQYFKQSILCIVSRTEDAELCYQLNIPYCWYPNEQLGAKWNHGLSIARMIDWDYLVTLGSDDIVKTSLFDFYAAHDQDVLITDKIHFVDVITGRATLTTRARVGAGRRISRKVIEACNYKLWTNDRNRSLDMDSNATIMRARFATTESHTYPHIVGLKSEVNIWGYDHLAQRGMNVSLDVALDGVPEFACNAIQELLSLTKPKNIAI